MADPQGLDVHDMEITHVPTFNRNGQPQSTTVVTYSVGPHGPFRLFYPSGNPEPDAVNADIDKHVAQIRAITYRPGQ